MAMPLLPVETLQDICTFATPHDLATLARTTRTFQDLSERVLYHSICPMTPQRTVKCLRTIASHPRIGRLVRSFSIGGRTWAKDPFPAIFDLIYRALCGMVRLSSLELNMFGRLSWMLPYLPRLRSFRTRIDCDATLAYWLSQQAGLTTLWLAPECRTLSFTRHPTSLPNLTYLATSPEIAAIVLPGTLVRDLDLQIPSVTPDILRNHIPAFSNCVVENLRIMTMSITAVTQKPFVELLESLAANLPEVRSLTISCLFWNPSEKFLPSIAPTLHTFTRLASLNIDVDDMKKRRKDVREDFAVLEVLNAYCRSLRSVGLPSGDLYQLA